MKDMHSLLEVIEDYGQLLLEDSNDLVILHSKNIADASVMNTIEKN